MQQDNRFHTIAARLRQNDYHGAMTIIEDLMGASAPDDDLIDAALSVRRRQEANTLSVKANSKAEVTLCMITKDEQSILGACLNAIKSMVDEIVVVDTGSTDRTPDVARIYGAKVFEFKWQDDFSVARNIALEKASGHWVLILDADEVIAMRDQKKLKQIIRQYHQHDIAFSIQTRNYTHQANGVRWRANDGGYDRYEAGMGWFPSQKVRLFPHCDKIRFQYPVHEIVEPSLRNAGISIAPCDICVHHYGGLNHAKNLKKSKQYFDLGFAKLDQLGNDAMVLRELAIQAGQLEYWSESLTLWKKVLGLQPDFEEGYVNAAGACWQMADYSQALVYAGRAIALSPKSKEGHYNLAVSLLLLGRADEAVETLQRLTRTYSDYPAAAFMLAAGYACTGNFKDSRMLFRSLLDTSVGKALPMAVKDLSNRLEACRRDSYALKLKGAAEVLIISENAN